jgi:hypothetical protein
MAIGDLTHTAPVIEPTVNEGQLRAAWHAFLDAGQAAANPR